jgi:carbon-monoxide dehydrogenase medium subunit
MYAFDLHRPQSLRKAVSLLQESEEAKLIAGGQTLIPTMKQRLAAPKNLIDLNGIGALSGIALKGRRVLIGAMTRHGEVADSEAVKGAIPALGYLASRIGDPAVRVRGTLGGSLATNDPAADYPAACLALNAVIVTSKRKIAADDFFKGLFETALEPDEIIQRVIFPVPRKAGYAKFPHPASRFALVGVFVAKRGRELRIAVTGAGERGVFRAKALEEALAKRFSPKLLEGVRVSAEGLISDIHASAEYRAHLIGVMARRAVGAATK